MPRPPIPSGARPRRIPPPPRGLPKHLRPWWLVLALVIPAVTAGVQTCQLKRPDQAGRPQWLVRTVHDGDTVTCTDAQGEAHRIRLVGIDAPEFHQSYGPESTAALQEKLGRRMVGIDGGALDQYGRVLATLWIDQRNINREMVAEGHAWVFGRFAPDADLVQAESEARKAHRGLWSDPHAVNPAQWRDSRPAQP